MVNVTEAGQIYTVFVRWPGEKKSYRVTPDGGVTSRKVFAAMIRSRERAEEIVAMIAEKNPHLETRIAKF